MNIKTWITAAMLIVAGMGATAAQAHDYRLGELRIEHPWSRATPPGAPGVGYMQIENEGAESDRLIDARSPVASRVSIHRTVEKDGMSKMIHQENGVAIPPGETLGFEPGGYHLMLMNLHQPLEAEQSVPVTLEFEHAGSVTIELSVEPLAGGGQSGH